MLKIFNDGPIYKMDYFVFHHKLKSIGITFLIIAIIFFVFFVFRPQSAEEGKSSLEYLVGVFTQGLFNWPGEGGGYDTYLLLLSITGTFLLSGFLYAVITNAMIGRGEKYKDGKLRYKMAGHTVIFGANSLLEATLDHLNKKEQINKTLNSNLWQKLSHSYIVIVSTHEPQTIRNRANRYDYIRNHVVVYNDELDDDNVFNCLNLDKAHEVFVLGDEEPKAADVFNARLVSMIINRFKKLKKSKRGKKNQRLTCNVSYFNSDILMAMLSDANKGDETSQLAIRDYLKIHPYNYLDGCLSFYWGSKCVERLFSNGTDEGNQFSLMPKDGKSYHFVIIGFNDLACYCVRQICSLAHFSQGFTTRITMITNAKQRFNYFREELGADVMPDIILECMESIDDLINEESNVSRYYVVATTDVAMDRMWMNHLSSIEHAHLLGYAEDHEEEINAEIKYFTTEKQHIGYWGFKKLRTHIKVQKNVYIHARLLYETYSELSDSNDDFDRLFPMQQMAWIDFYNYLYYLIMVSGCKLQSRPKINSKGKTEDEIKKESESEQLKAKANTLLSMTFAQDKIQHALNNYKVAQTALHRGDSAAAKHYQDQLDHIIDKCNDIVAQYLAKATKSGLQLMLDIFSYPYDDSREILYSPIARKILLLNKQDADRLKQGSFDRVSEDVLCAFDQLREYVPVALQPKVKQPADYTLLTVLPTNKCNFGCSYCYAAAGRDNSTIDLPRLKNAIDFFFDSKPHGFKRPLTISFMGGGEPLMAFDLVKSAVEYAHRRSKLNDLKLNIRIITNGSLVDEDFIAFCQEKNVEVSVSFDVIEEVQNLQRGDYNVVTQNLTEMCEAGLSVQINTTITNLNVSQMSTMLETIHERWPRVKAVMFEPVSGRMGMSNIELETFIAKYEQNFITCLSLADKYGISLTSFAYLRTVFPLDRACPGELCVTSHGDITGCYCVGSPKAPLYKETKYGEVNYQKVEFDMEKYHKLIQENVYGLSECKDCEVKWNCGGGCYYQRNLFDADYRNIHCDFTRRFVKDIIHYRVDRFVTEHKEQVQLPLLIDNR